MKVLSVEPVLPNVRRRIYHLSEPVFESLDEDGEIFPLPVDKEMWADNYERIGARGQLILNAIAQIENIYVVSIYPDRVEIQMRNDAQPNVDFNWPKVDDQVIAIIEAA